ncbi:MAG: hypothetical protein A2X64_04580 [Ignavibacteria bacterium GWF2_33_9]|nr:MAG: hypothetical protein A2X64_04580 [Ignavibacteria bacterium GWF2_33_9]
MNFFKIIILFEIFTTILSAQTYSIEELVRQGVELHEQGKYNEAIKKYEEALKIDENSALANLEMAVTCLSLELYDYATKYATIALVEATEDRIKMGAYLVLGSVLEKRNLPLEAVNVYEEAIQLFPHNFDLYYKLAVQAIKLEDFEKGETAIISSIKENSAFPEPYLILNDLMLRKKARIKAMFSIYYFLMLEPDSPAAQIYLKLLLSLFTYEGDVKYFGNSNTHAHLFINMNEREFSSAEALLHMTFYNKTIEYKDKEAKTLEFFMEMTKEFFQIVKNSSQNSDGFWWENFVNKFADILTTNNLEPFCYYISQSLNSPEVQKWIENNQEKIDALRLWIDLNK